MDRIPKKKSWKEHVREIELYHLKQLMIYKHHWSIRKTSKALNRSIASVSEDLRLSLAIRIYPELEELATKDAALNVLRTRGKCRIYPCGKWNMEEIGSIIKSLSDA